MFQNYLRYCDAIAILDGLLSSSKKPLYQQASLGNITEAVKEGAPDSLAVLGFFFEVFHPHLDALLDQHLDLHLYVHLGVFDAWVFL